MAVQRGYPIVLAHSICRFDHLLNETFGLENQDDDSLHYFMRIRSTLQMDGFTVRHSKVSRAASVDVRAADHLNEIGWSDSTEPDCIFSPERLERRIQQFYLSVARSL